jgi:hypothetical protein
MGKTDLTGTPGGLVIPNLNEQESSVKKQVVFFSSSAQVG